MLASAEHVQPVLLVDAVGLTPSMVGPKTPRIAALAEGGSLAPMQPVLPAVTCSAQATMLTGLAPDEHGAVGNGWLDPATREVAFWRQANSLVRGEKLYETVHRLAPGARVAKLFWWWNMGADVDFSITPRPFYPADGRKIPAVYAQPHAFGEELERALGPFPFFSFWGPAAGLLSSRWITDAAIHTLERYRPDLTLVYLPHLDYDLQRHGPEHPKSRRAVEELDALIGDLAGAAEAVGAALVVVSEYGLEAAQRPILVNRALREAGLLAVRETPVGEVLDVFASRAFALADHQLVHIHTRDAAAREEAAALVRRLAGVAGVWVGPERAEVHLDHPRAGDVVAVAARGAWFAYPYWLDEAAAPDFARTVDIHRKPGYDPCELLLDPRLALGGKPRILRRLLQKKLGMRYLMDVVPLDPSLVRGTHGRLPDDPREGPLFLCSRPFEACGGEPDGERVAMGSVRERVLALLGLSD